MRADYLETLKALKSAILTSRYKAASSVNKELLLLYFSLDKFISVKIREEKWGAKVIETLSTDLQVEMPGLRRFSATNIKRMKVFYGFWNEHFVISPSVTDELQLSVNKELTFRPSVTDQLQKTFFNVSFTHHIELLRQANSLPEITYYIQKIAAEFWSLSTLKHHLKNKSLANSGSLPNNYASAIPNIETRNKALQSFKDAETLKKLMD